MGSFKLSRLKPILDWVPAVLSVLMIALESTSTMSAKNTSEWLYPYWVRFFGPISMAHWDQVHHLIRKTGHFVGYGLVSVAFFYSWRRRLSAWRSSIGPFGVELPSWRCSALCSSPFWMSTIRASCPAGPVRLSTSASI